mgnify:CR=1 FL=1
MVKVTHCYVHSFLHEGVRDVLHGLVDEGNHAAESCSVNVFRPLFLRRFNISSVY